MQTRSMLSADVLVDRLRTILDEFAKFNFNTRRKMVVFAMDGLCRDIIRLFEVKNRLEHGLINVVFNRFNEFKQEVLSERTHRDLEQVESWFSKEIKRLSNEIN